MLAISGAVAQWPIGMLSDSFDRRLVIIYTTFGAAFFALCAIFASRQMYLPGELATSKSLFYIFLILFSFCSLPMFAIIFAHTNDFIPKEKFVAAGASLQFAFGLGAISGPFLCSILMNLLSKSKFIENYNFGIPQIIQKEFIADIDTPISSLLKITKDEKYSFLLESVEGGDQRGRFSLLGCDPDLIWEVKDNKVTIKPLDQDLNL